MDQKNTIVKCKAHPDCLFNHNGICDNYVIHIGADGKCQCYVETATEEEQIYNQTKEMLKASNVTFKVAEFDTPNKNKTIIPLNSITPETACTFTADNSLWDKEFIDDVKERFKNFRQESLEKYIQLTPEERELMNDIGYIPPKEETTPSEHTCDFSCKYALCEKPELNSRLYCTKRGACPERPHICACYEPHEDCVAKETCINCVHRENTGLMHAYCQLQECYVNRSAEVCDAFEKRTGNFRKGQLSMCWWCDYFNSDRKKCSYHPAPDIDNQGECHSIQSTGANR